MLAIVSIMRKPGGIDEVQLLGWGHTEGEARVNAYAYTHHGHNDFDEEFAGGVQVNVCAALCELRRAADKWHDTVDESGGLVESSAPEAHHRLLSALGRLMIVGNELRVRT